MAIALFPLPDGGTIGANIAIYGEFIGAETTLAMRCRLFGYPCRPDTRLPSGLNHLAEEARDYWNLEPAEIILRNTEFYYATASVPAGQRESMFSDMLKQPDNRCLRRRASGWTGELVPKFRYCEACLSEWRAARILAHWMVDHQLPGVYVCPTHSSVMKVAKRWHPQNLTDATVMALRSSDDEEILTRASASQLGAIAALARLSADCRKAARSLPSIGSYRELLRVAGYVWPTGGVDVRAFAASMIEHFGQEYCQLAGLSLQRVTIWLRTISDEGKAEALAHPFVFIAAESFLNSLCASAGSLIPQTRKPDTATKESTKNNIRDNLFQRANALRCKGILHRANDTWKECLSDDAGWKLVCSCGLAYVSCDFPQLAETSGVVMTYGERYRNLVCQRFADNFIVDRASKAATVNPRLLRWARFCGFSRRKDLSAEMTKDLRHRWYSVVKNARPDKRITSSRQIDSKLYQTLYLCDRDWLARFNKKNRTRRSVKQHTVEDSSKVI
ncbi:TnsD family Tn7-like transposition protein [Paraburkholderia youngii]|uniref:TnsD family Tn7-like transposition protein n=1 Tax=Paraburkholderia youngii TaxID=2782701 RepID=UPI003D199CE6